MFDSNLENKWKRIISSWQSSDKPAVIWCKENDITYQEFSLWYSRRDDKLFDLYLREHPDCDFHEVDMLYRDILLQLAGDLDLGDLVRCIDFASQTKSPMPYRSILISFSTRFDAKTLMRCMDHLRRVER